MFGPLGSRKGKVVSVWAGRSAGAGWLPGCRDPVPDRAVVGLPGDALGLGRLDRLDVGGRGLVVGGVGAVGVGPGPAGVGAVAEDPPAANFRVGDLAGDVALEIGRAHV